MTKFLKPVSICRDLALREIFGSQKYSWTAGQNIPSDLVEYFECPVTSSYQLENNNCEIVPPYACDFSLFPSEEHLALISKEDGSVMLVDAYRKDRKAIVDNWFAHNNAIYDIKWLRCDRHFLTASADQSICLHDAPTKQQLIRFFGHSSSVKTLSICPQSNSVFASGSRDGTIRIWDSRNLKTMKIRGCEGVVNIHKIENCHAPEWKSFGSNNRRKKLRPKGTITGSVTSISYLNDGTIVSSGSTDGKIKFWDTRKLTSRGDALPRSILTYSGNSQKSIGYSDLMVNYKYNRLFAYCLDSVIYEYDLYSTSDLPVRRYSGHTASSFYLKQSLSPDDRFLVCGSSDSFAYIYPLEPTACKPYILRGHQSEVTVPCWCPSDPSKLITLSDDCCVFIWQMRPDRRYRLPERRELVGMTECSSRIKLNHKAKLNPSTPPTPINMGAVQERSSARLSQRLRQVNIQQFLTPSPQLKSPQSAVNIILDNHQSNGGMPFSKIENTIVSPKRLLLSPRNLFPTDHCQASCLSQNNVLPPMSNSATNSASNSNSLVRKRLRFDFSALEETEAKLSPQLSDSTNLHKTDNNVDSRSLRRSSSLPGGAKNKTSPKTAQRKRKASDLDIGASPDKIHLNKRIREETENIPPVELSSPITPLSTKPSVLKMAKSLSRSNNCRLATPELNKTDVAKSGTPLSSPMISTTPSRSNPGLKTPKSSGRRSSRRIEKNLTPITDYFKPT